MVPSTGSPALQPPSSKPSSPRPVKLLDEKTINQIAAGEVIERPASVVKELVENSLDAGATRVEVRLREGGRQQVAVRDNGHGMERGDLLLAFRKHATSKINSFADLERVLSFGFRGEALASIASVARVRALSRPQGQPSATLVLIEGGNVGSVQEEGGPRGTLIEVVDLFYNVPARQKYLKTTPTELRHCLTAVTSLALAHPEATFQVEHNGRELLNVPASSQVRERLAALLGPEVARELVEVTYASPHLKISGWVGKPALMRKTKGALHLFINGRPVQAQALQRGLREAYGNLLPARHYPVALLSLELDPGQVDVNVHPAKRWVRFADERSVVRALQRAVQVALQEKALIPHLELPRPVEGGSPGLLEPVGGGPTTARTRSTVPFPAPEPAPSQAQLEVASPGEVLPPDTTLPEMEPLGMLDRKYILARDSKALYIIDYHAAHERVMYERLRLSHRYAKVASQALLNPRTVELAPAEAVTLQEHLEELEELGFGVEHFGGTSFVVRAVPTLLGGAVGDRELRATLAELAAAGQARSLAQRVEGFLYTVACHSALRAGEELTEARQRWLLAEMASIPNPYACVHGRPTVMTITADELDAKFKRKGF